MLTHKILLVNGLSKQMCGSWEGWYKIQVSVITAGLFVLTIVMFLNVQNSNNLEKESLAACNGTHSDILRPFLNSCDSF